MRKLFWIIPLLCLLIIPKIARAFTFAWDETVPTNAAFGYQLDDYMRQFNTSIRERLAIDHYFLSSDLVGTDSIGFHKQISFIDGTTPDTDSYGGRLYTKSTGGISTLYFLTNTGADVQLTAGSSAVIGSQGLLKDCFNGDTGVLNQVVDVLGFDTPGDSGGGMFYWDGAEPKANHNGGTIIDPTHSDTYISDTVATDTTWTDTSWWVAENTGNGCWKRQIDGPYNVKWFGAKGNGVMDETYPINFAIKAAYDSTVADSGVSDVNIPAGTYHINGNQDGLGTAYNMSKMGIQLLSGINLKLTQNTILELITCDTDNYSIISIRDRDNCSVTGGFLIGDSLTHPNPPAGYGSGHGIHIRGSRQVKISDVYVSRCYGDGILVTGIPNQILKVSENITVRDCISTYNFRQGMSIGGATHVNVLNNEFSYTSGGDPQAGLDIEPENAQNVIDVLVDGNKFKNNVGAGVTLGTPNLLIQNIRIVNNRITANDYGGINITAGNRIIASNNNIYSNGLSGVFVTDAPTRVIVSNNTISLNGSGIILYGATKCLVSNNSIGSNLTYGIALQINASYNTIIGNVCDSNMTDTGIESANVILQSADYNNVQNNTCIVGTNTNKPVNGIELNTDGTIGNFIANNFTKNGGTTKGIKDDGAGTFLRGNILNDGTWSDTGAG